eukprot:1274294-Prymnesium_polylepis.1
MACAHILEEWRHQADGERREGGAVLAEQLADDAARGARDLGAQVLWRARRVGAASHVRWRLVCASPIPIRLLSSTASH